MKKPVRPQGKKPKQDLVIEVDVKKLVCFLVILAMVLVFALCTFFVVRRFLTVQSFLVSGISEYEAEEIIAASGVKRGDRLYLLDPEKIEESVLQKCPYLSSIKVHRDFPNTLRFEVEGKLGHWYIDVAGARYALDGDLVVISETAKVDGLTRLILPNLKSTLVGQVPSFGESETEIKKTIELVSILRETTFHSRLTLVDLSDRTDILLEVDGKYRVLMGDASDFEAKLLEVEVILDQELVKNAEGGEINATVPGHSGFRPARPSSAENAEEREAS